PFVRSNITIVRSNPVGIGKTASSAWPRRAWPAHTARRRLLDARDVYAGDDVARRLQDRRQSGQLLVAGHGRQIEGRHDQAAGADRPRYAARNERLPR